MLQTDYIEEKENETYSNSHTTFSEYCKEATPVHFKLTENENLVQDSHHLSCNQTSTKVSIPGQNASRRCITFDFPGVPCSPNVA